MRPALASCPQVPSSRRWTPTSTATAGLPRPPTHHGPARRRPNRPTMMTGGRAATRSTRPGAVGRHRSSTLHAATTTRVSSQSAMIRHVWHSVTAGMLCFAAHGIFRCMKGTWPIMHAWMHLACTPVRQQSCTWLPSARAGAGLKQQGKQTWKYTYAVDDKQPVGGRGSLYLSIWAAGLALPDGPSAAQHHPLSSYLPALTELHGTPHLCAAAVQCMQQHWVCEACTCVNGPTASACR